MLKFSVFLSLVLNVLVLCLTYTNISKLLELRGLLDLDLKSVHLWERNEGSCLHQERWMAGLNTLVHLLDLGLFQILEMVQVKLKVKVSLLTDDGQILSDLINVLIVFNN